MDEEYFWALVEAEVGQINDHLKQILKIQNLCTAALADLTRDGVKAVEQDMREMGDFLQEEEAESGIPLAQIYGKIFAQTPHKFKFLEGEILMLLTIADLIKEKGFKNFMEKATPKARVCQDIREVENLKGFLLEKIRVFYDSEDFEEIRKCYDVELLYATQITVKETDDGKIMADVFCPICLGAGKNHSVTLPLSNTGNWNIYGFKRHFALVHNNGPERKTAKDMKRNGSSIPHPTPKKKSCAESAKSAPIKQEPAI